MGKKSGILLCTILVVSVLVLEILLQITDVNFYAMDAEPGGDVKPFHAVQRFVNRSFLDKFHSQRPSSYRTSPGTRPTKRILFWSDPMHIYDWFDSTAVPDFAGCPVQDCQVVVEKDRVDEADAVIIAGVRIVRGGLPRKRPGQRWIYLMAEAPLHAVAAGLPGKVSRVSPFIDWTMSYRTDSDIYRPYGTWEPFEEPPEMTRRRQEKLHSKSLPVVWAVSHCLTPSRREDYVKELRKYVQVDVWGSCPFRTTQCSRETVAGERGCQDHMETTYLFYLAFENAHCTDYVTEKFWLHLAMDIVPVVMGGSLLDKGLTYQRVAPPGKSYIDVQDFDSPSHLAAYLKYLDANRTAYGEYFEWKKHARVATRILGDSLKEPATWCSLCDKLHNDNVVDERRSPYWLRDWFFDGNSGGYLWPPRYQHT